MNNSRHTDLILIEILVENQSIMESQSPICMLDHRPSTIELQSSSKNVSVFMRNSSSSSGLVLYLNETLNGRARNLLNTDFLLSRSLENCQNRCDRMLMLSLSSV